MTRKDYVAIAAALLAARRQALSVFPERRDPALSGEFYSVVNALNTATDRVADTLAAENHRFDRGRFLAAAGHNFPNVSVAA